MIMRALLSLMVLAWFVSGSAHAASGQCAASDYSCDQGQAFAACQAYDPTPENGGIVSVSRRECVLVESSDSRGYYLLSYWGMQSNGTEVGAFRAGNWYYGKSCSSRGAVSNMRFTGDAGACSNGCAYAVSSDGGWSSTTIGGIKVTTASSMLPMGGVCTAGDSTNTSEPLGKEDKCVQTGTLTQCVRSDGKHCATASTGKTFCWSPSESGVKTADSGNQAATKSPENTQINAPKDAPKNGGDWTVTGQGQVTTSSNGGSSTTSNITTFDSSYGKDGTGKGDGSGSGDDSGSGDGEGDDDGDDDGNGSVGEGVGDLYEASDRTVEGVVGQFYEKVMATDVVSGLTDFMSVQGGGSCPVFNLPASKYWNAVTFNAHCSGEFLAFLRAAGYVILAMAAYLAIKIAVT